MLNRISIKYKLLVALILLPLSGLSLYTYFAVKLIKEDKIAYVINATNSNAKSLTTSLLLTLESHRTLNELVLNDFLKNNIGKDFLKKVKQKNIIYISSFKLSENNEFVVEEDKSFVTQDYEKDFKKNNIQSHFNDFLKTFRSETNQYFLFKMLPELQANVYFTYDAKAKEAFFIITLAETFFNELAKKDFYSKAILVNGQIYVWGDELNDKLAMKIFKEHNNLKFAKSSEQKDFLYSLGPQILSGKIRILTLSDKKYVYAPIYQLTEKTVIFFLLLLGVSLSLSILISDQLSKRIIVLTDSTKKIAEGNYDITIKDKTGDEVGQLGKSFEAMALQVKNLLDQLRKHNEKLEQTVAERTRDLRETLNLKDAMLNSLGQGFFIFKEDGGVENIFTKATFDMFENVKEKNKIWDILNFSQEENIKFQKVIEHAFMEILDFEDAVALAPDQMTTKDDKYIGLQYFPLKPEDDIEGVILVATDKTEEVKARKSYETERTETKKLSLALRAQSMFLEYIKEFDNSFHRIMETIETRNDNLLKNIKSPLHTMKGLSYQFFFNSVGNKVHEIEDFINGADFKKEENLNRLENLLTESYSLFNEEIQHVADYLSIDSSDKTNVPRTISSKVLDQFYKKVEGTIVEESYFKEIYSIRISEILAPYLELTKDLAKDLGKEIAPLEIVGGNCKVHPHKYTSFFLSLTHIFRNIVIHGLETPAERENLGKGPQGKIQVVSTIGEHSLNLAICDDGAGIDTEKIKEKLREINHPLLEKDPSDEDLFMVIFEQSFSTSENVDEASGRGIGLSAVSEEIRKLKGKIKVKSLQNEGTQFIISIPL